MYKIDARVLHRSLYTYVIHICTPPQSNFLILVSV